MNAREPVVKAVNISKRFGKVQALRNVDFTVYPSEVVGLVGDNGAGKSTLIKILSGVYPPEEGEIWFEGRKVSFSSPKMARTIGIETVFQDMALINLMSIWRNFFLGREIDTKIGFLDLMNKGKMNEDCRQALAEIGITARSTGEKVGLLSGGERQSISIGRAIHFKAKLVILDEPTAALSIKEAEKVLSFVTQLKQAGVSVVFITHNIHHVYSVADRFVVLEHAAKIGEFARKDVTPEDIIDVVRSGWKEPPTVDVG